MNATTLGIGEKRTGPVSEYELTRAMEMEMVVSERKDTADVTRDSGVDMAASDVQKNKECQIYDETSRNRKEREPGRANEDPARGVLESEHPTHQPSSCFVFVWIRAVKAAAKQYGEAIWRVVKVVLFLLYLTYSVYSLYRTWGTESATRLLLLLAIVLYVGVGSRLLKLLLRAVSRLHVRQDAFSWARKVGRWSLYVVAGVGAVTYLAIEVVPQRPYNLISLAGLTFLVLLAMMMSADPERINWHTVFWGISLQFYLAIFVLRTKTGYNVFHWLGDRVEEYIGYTNAGCKFLFGDSYEAHPFVFKSMPVIIFLNCTIALLYHFGVVQAVIATFGRFLGFCLGTTPIESVNAVGNIFLGLAEAPLLIKPFLNDITGSELFAVMTGGYASIAGGIMATIIVFGIPANHVLAASMMSAPAALAIAKVMCPSTVPTPIRVQDAYTVELGASKNLLQSLSTAAVISVSVIVTICANLLFFVSFLRFADLTLEWFGDQAGVEDFSFTRLLSYVFYPLMYLCGVDTEDLLVLGRLVGVKVLTSTQLGYKQAADIIHNSNTLAEYTARTNGTWRYSGDDVILEAWNRTLVGGVMNERSEVMSTYILCGLCNVSSIGNCIGSLSALVPKRTGEIVRYAVWACVAGNIACLMTGCVAVSRRGHRAGPVNQYTSILRQPAHGKSVPLFQGAHFSFSWRNLQIPSTSNFLNPRACSDLRGAEQPLASNGLSPLQEGRKENGCCPRGGFSGSRFTTQVISLFCDADLVFINCVAKWPGSVHNARVLRYGGAVAAENGHMFYLQLFK
ncbi:hypothetical protein BaRGS_00037579 [Batillaria attramentaria]|uniref:Sodium/nucleoside cotransporter n=2 Tax=Batillaria attramentaria TaxID=370345 RepID=A0ABD0J863_9CAEN